MINVGAVAPDFLLPDQLGNGFHLADARGKANVLIVFVPRCFTPICSTEVPELAGALDRFTTDAQTWPVVIDVDGVDPNLAWMRELSKRYPGVLRLRLLSDSNPPGAVARAYGVLAPDYVAERSTVILDRNGIVRYAVVAGRTGKRSIPGLLQIAKRVNAGKSIPAQIASAGMMVRPDLPTLYVAGSCGHCAQVKMFLSKSGLSQRVIVKDVMTDARAGEENPRGTVPTLVMPNGSIYDDANQAVAALQQAYGVAA